MKASNTFQLLNRIVFFRKLWSVLYNFLLLYACNCFKLLLLFMAYSIFLKVTKALFTLESLAVLERPLLLQVARSICKTLTQPSNQGEVLYLHEGQTADCLLSIPFLSILFNSTLGKILLCWRATPQFQSFLTKQPQ